MKSQRDLIFDSIKRGGESRRCERGPYGLWAWDYLERWHQVYL